MPREQIECKYCGEVCGSYFPAHISGPPEDCCEAEYDTEPGATDDEGNEFCDADCAAAYHAENRDQEDDDE